MPPLRIESSSNSRLKITRSLSSRPGIIRNDSFLLEGARFIADYLDRGSPLWIIVSDAASPASLPVAARARKRGVPALQVSAKIFAGVATTKHSQGIAAVCPLPTRCSEEKIPRGTLLLLDGIADPGNMGTIIRSAAAFACACVILGRGCCCPFTPKVTRASAGMNIAVPLLFDVDLPAFMEQRRENLRFLGADASGKDTALLHTGKFPAGIVIGAERRGLSTEVRSRLDGVVAIPMAAGIDSLNAAVSASILLYELFRA